MTVARPDRGRERSRESLHRAKQAWVAWGATSGPQTACLARCRILSGLRSPGNQPGRLTDRRLLGVGLGLDCCEPQCVSEVGSAHIWDQLLEAVDRLLEQVPGQRG